MRQRYSRSSGVANTFRQIVDHAYIAVDIEIVDVVGDVIVDLRVVRKQDVVRLCVAEVGGKESPIQQWSEQGKVNQRVHVDQTAINNNNKE